MIKIRKTGLQKNIKNIFKLVQDRILGTQMHQ